MLLAGVASWSCSNEYDDSALRGDLKSLAERIEAVQASLTSINNELNSYKTLLEGLQGARYITQVSESQGAVTITYNDGTSVTLKPGKKGATVLYEGLKSRYSVQSRLLFYRYDLFL